MLTQRQHDALSFIHAKLRESGIPPSYDEIAAALDMRSKGGICQLVDALEERGFIRRLRGRPRAIEVIRLPEHFESRPFRSTPKPPAGKPLNAGRIPIMGRISAGLPLSAIQTATGSISLPADMEGDFALEMRGDSMIDAGILDADIIVFRKQDFAHTGDTVLAVIDDEEATIKRYRQKGASCALEPAHSAYETRIFGPGRVYIQGRMVGLVRRY